MEQQIDYIRQTRNNFSVIFKAFSLEQLNIIPPGFKNNLIWNYGHIIVTQQLLCYKLSSLDMYISDEMVNKYRKGSKPEELVSQTEYAELQGLSSSLLSKLSEDLANNKFIDYAPYPTSYGIELKSIHDAVKFNALHEAMHLGYALALRKAIL